MQHDIELQRIYLLVHERLPWHFELHCLASLRHLHLLPLQPVLQLHLSYPWLPVTAVFPCASLPDMLELSGTSLGSRKDSLHTLNCTRVKKFFRAPCDVTILYILLSLMSITTPMTFRAAHLLLSTSGTGTRTISPIDAGVNFLLDNLRNFEASCWRFSMASFLFEMIVHFRSWASAASSTVSDTGNADDCAESDDSRDPVLDSSFNSSHERMLTGCFDGSVSRFSVADTSNKEKSDFSAMTSLGGACVTVLDVSSVSSSGIGTLVDRSDADTVCTSVCASSIWIDWTCEARDYS